MNEERKNQQAAAEPSLSEILQVRRDKLKALQDAGRDPFTQTRFARSAYSADIKNDFDAYDVKTLQAAGRIMSKRGMGKAIFCDIQDDRGQIQLYVRKDAVSEQEFADFRKYDIGDIIGVSGYAFKTKTGEISIHVQQVTLLSKSLRPLPEKFHGMTNTELRYRQRYVDLIMNPESKRNFQIRSRFVAYLRRYLDNLGFMEVETPVLSPIAGGATARPFITHHNTLDIDMYMRIATELHLKRLIVGGIERVYEVGRIFRNEGMDTKHNPEFTTCELYQAYTNLDGMMDILEGILSGAAKLERDARIGTNIGCRRCSKHDVHIISIIILQNFIGDIPLLGEIHSAPLGKTLAVPQCAAAILRKIWGDAALADDIIVENLIYDLRDVAENIAIRDKRLVVGSGVGNIKIIALASIPFGIDAVERVCSLR